MKIVSVVGSGSGCGKTTVACGILRAFPGLGAVKISPRAGSLVVEWGAGEPGKDTDRFFRSGASRVARIVGLRDEVGLAWERIQGEFRGLRAVVVEGAGGRAFPGEKLTIFVGMKGWNLLSESKNREIAVNSSIIIDFSSHIEVDRFSDHPEKEELFSRIAAFLAPGNNG